MGRLGRGQMGAVYKVMLEDLGKIMALKVLQPDDLLENLMGTEIIRRVFLSEARLMATHIHENIAAVWDLGEHEGLLYMAMEYFSMNIGTLIGESYIVEQPSRPLPPPIALDYTKQTLEGLTCLHHAGIVHRDIKPFNLMLTNSGCVKIIDLGLSKVRGEVIPSPKGLKVGSPYYASPEQEMSPETDDVRMDLYSAGVLLYRMVTGRLPEESGSPLDHPLLSRPWQTFFKKALAHKPKNRFNSAWEMIDGVKELEAEWHARKEAECVLEEIEKPDAGKALQPLRSRPIKTGVKTKTPFKGLDPLFQPRAYVDNRFIPKPDGMMDTATGLLWRKRISRLPMYWTAASSYLDRINKGRPHDSCWRLPTVEELTTLLRPKERIQDFCSPAWFDQEKPWIWTADRRSYVTAWFVDVVNGAVMYQDFTSRFHVLAVM